MWNLPRLRIQLSSARGVSSQSLGLNKQMKVSGHNWGQGGRGLGPSNGYKRFKKWLEKYLIIILQTNVSRFTLRISLQGWHHLLIWYKRKYKALPSYCLQKVPRWQRQGQTELSDIVLWAIINLNILTRPCLELVTLDFDLVINDICSLREKTELRTFERLKILMQLPFK